MRVPGVTASTPEHVHASPWREWFYCATCDGSVSRIATECKHCGAKFGPQS